MELTSELSCPTPRIGLSPQPENDLPTASCPGNSLSAMLRVMMTEGIATSASGASNADHSMNSSGANWRPATILGPSVSRNRSEEHTSELQSLMRISYAVFCLKNTKTTHDNSHVPKTHIAS